MDLFGCSQRRNDQPLAKVYTAFNKVYYKCYLAPCYDIMDDLIEKSSPPLLSMINTGQ